MVVRKSSQRKVAVCEKPDKGHIFCPEIFVKNL